MAGDLTAEIGDGFRFVDATRGDGQPLARLLDGRIKRTSSTQVGHRFLINTEVDDTLRPDDLQAKTCLFNARILHRIEKQRHAVCHFKTGMHLIARESADAFIPLLDIGFRDRPAILHHGGTARLRCATEVSGEVEQMRAEHP